MLKPEEVASGAFAGLVGTVLGYPLDVVKSRMQTNAGARAGFGRTLAHLVRTDGPVGMYRGVGPPIAMMVLMNGVNFPAFYHFKRVVGGPQGLHDSSREVGWGTTHGSVDPTVILAGALVGPICAIVGTPFELVKLQMQLDGGGDGMRAKRAYKNSAECARTLWRKYGPRVFYLGYGVNTVRECVFNGVFFSTFEHINHGIRRDVLGAGSDSVAVALAGGVAGTVGWFANLPLDCVKSGIQGQRLGSPAPGEWRVRNYAKVGFLEAAAEVRARPGGWINFFSGAAPSAARSVLVSGSRFAAYAFMLERLGGGGVGGIPLGE